MTIVVYGATSRTARLLAPHIATRWPIVLVGRDAVGLSQCAAELGDASWAVARSDDPAALRRAFAGARVVVQCASLGTDDAARVAASTVAVGASYLDVCADATVGDAIAARVAEVPLTSQTPLVVCPGVAPIGGALAEWLAVAALRHRTGELVAPDAIDLAYCSAGLSRTPGSLHSALRMLSASPHWSTHTIDFPPPFAREHCFGFPLGCGRLRQHFPAAAIRTWAALAPPTIGSPTTASLLRVAHDLLERGDGHSTLAAVVAPMLDATRAAHDADPDRLPFAVVAQVTHAGLRTSMSAVGERPYSTTVAMQMLVLSTIVQGIGRSGVLGAAEIVRAEAALDWLTNHAALRLFVDHDGAPA